MNNAKHTIAKGALTLHVKSSLGGCRWPNALYKVTAILFDIGAAEPDRVGQIVREFLSHQPPSQRIKLVARAAGSVLAGFSHTRRYVSEAWAVEGILEQSFYAADHGYIPSDEEVTIITNEIHRGWKHPWRNQSVEYELKQREKAGRPSTSDKEVLARYAAGLREAERGNWSEAARIATNIGQVLRRRAASTTNS